MLGFGHNSLEITYKNLDKILKNKHYLAIDDTVLKQLIPALANPLAIFQNYDSKAKKVIKDEVVIVANLKGVNGEYVQVPVTFNIRNGMISVNRIKSTFARQTHKWYIRMLENKRLLYLDMIDCKIYCNK